MYMAAATGPEEEEKEEELVYTRWESDTTRGRRARVKSLTGNSSAQRQKT